MKIIRNDPKLKERRKRLRHHTTETEGRLWLRLRNRQLDGMKFIRQYSVGPYILDFYCPKAAVSVELDGSQHNSEEVHSYDHERTAYLASLGIRELRFWNIEVFARMEGVLERIRREITPPSLPLPQGEGRQERDRE
jgi:very-short-patch-repair endonuclease